MSTTQERELLINGKMCFRIRLFVIIFNVPKLNQTAYFKIEKKNNSETDQI